VPIKKPTIQYAILAVLLLWASLSQLTYTGFSIYAQAISDKHVQIPFRLDEFSTKISAVEPAYQSSDLWIGDDVMALNGQMITSARQFEHAWFHMGPGEMLSVTVLRSHGGGRTEKLTIPLKLQKHPSRALGWTMVIMFSGILPLTCLLIGFYIVFARPRDPLAWITMAMLASFGQLVTMGYSWFISSPLREILAVYHFLLNNSWPLWMLLFAYYFPIPFPFLKKRSWLVWLPAIPSLILVLIDI
jgi:phosphoserine phosphatase RsbU/P